MAKALFIKLLKPVFFDKRPRQEWMVERVIEIFGKNGFPCDPQLAADQVAAGLAGG